MTSSFKEHIAGVRAVDRHVAHGACLVLGGLVVRWPGWTNYRKGVTLQAQQVHLADPQQTRVGRPVWGVAAHATLGLHRNMLEHERPLLIGVAAVTDCVTAGQGFHLPQGRGAVNVVAVVAADQPFFHPMVVGLGKIRLLRNVAAVAQLRLSLHQQVLGFFGFVRRMAIQATHVIAGVHGA